MFCKQLGDWFAVSDWHYSTLLTVLIDVTIELPSDANALVDELLYSFDEKPNTNTIIKYLESSNRLSDWFGSQAAPRVSSVCLVENQFPLLTNPALPLLNTENDLAQWLGVSSAELDWLAALYRDDEHAQAACRHYHYNVVKKRNGSPRLIESPKKILREIQRRILREILENVPIHDAAHGFRKTRGCKTHGALHCGKKWLFTFDLSNYFHSIRWPSVHAIFIGLGYPPPVSRLLTALTTHRCTMTEAVITGLPLSQKRLLRERHLPQGAPSSPALSNAVLYYFDRRLSGLADSLDLVYSRYGDDLAFSGNVDRDWRFFQPLIGSISLEEGLLLNYRKTRIMKAHQKQRLTGIVVNVKPNVDRKYYDKLKATLTNCSKYGVEMQNRDNHPDFCAYLKGSIAHVKHLNSKKGEALEVIYKDIVW